MDMSEKFSFQPLIFKNTFINKLFINSPTETQTLTLPKIVENG